MMLEEDNRKLNYLTGRIIMKNSPKLSYNMYIGTLNTRTLLGEERLAGLQETLSKIKRDAIGKTK